MYRYALRYESIMWKLLQFSLTYFGQKFRESNVFTKETSKVSKIIIWKIQYFGVQARS